MDVQGIVAIVTGGASGLGAATARKLADRGAHVVIADLQRRRRSNALPTRLVERIVKPT